MSDNFDESVAFSAACDLVLKEEFSLQVILSLYCTKKDWKEKPLINYL